MFVRKRGLNLITVSLEKLDYLHKEIEEFFGEEMIGALEVLSSDIKGMTAHSRAEALAHPLAPVWKQFKKEMLRSKKESVLLFSEKSVKFLELYDSLLAISELDNFERINSRIRKKDHFYSAAFEAKIASSYLEEGCSVEIVDEAGSSRSPDFLIRTDEGGKIYVECKSLEDKKRTEIFLWDQLFPRIRNTLDRYRREWSIFIAPENILSGSDLDVIAKTIELAAEQGKVGDLKCPGFIIRVRENPSLLKAKNGEISIGRGDSDLLYMEFDIATSTPPDFSVKNIRALSIEQFFTPNQFDRIDNALKTANKQLCEDTPYVVHVELPEGKGDKITEVVDFCYDRLLGKVKVDYKNVSILVISSFIFSDDQSFDTCGSREFHVLIPNYASRNNLPKGFGVLGSCLPSNDVRQFESNPQEGSIVIEFSINEPLDAQQGRSLLWRSSNDGRYQLRLSQTHMNKFRVEVVTPDLGRKYQDFDLNWLPVGEPVKLAASWSEDGIRLAALGKIVNPVQRT